MRVVSESVFVCVQKCVYHHMQGEISNDCEPARVYNDTCLYTRLHISLYVMCAIFVHIFTYGNVHNICGVSVSVSECLGDVSVLALNGALLAFVFLSSMLISTHAQLKYRHQALTCIW